MNNPETYDTLDRRHRVKTNKTKNTTQENKTDEQHRPTNNSGLNSGSPEGLAAPVSYKTPFA